jgi:colicin import membrane protein
MHQRELGETRKRQGRYAALAVAVVALAAGLIFLTNHVERTTASTPTETAAPAETAAARSRRLETGASTSPATTPAVAASTTAAQPPSGDEVTVVNGLRRDEAVALIGDARRQAAAGNYTEAEALLARAEKVVPGLPETQQALVDVARLKTPEGQFADHIQRARLALDHDDSASAESELAEAARLRADAPEIAELRAALRAAHDKKARREARIADALARMREAMARRDFAAANGALNEAERIDVQEPTIRQARRELARAQDAQPQNAHPKTSE